MGILTMGVSIGDLRAATAGYILEFGEKKAARIWQDFGGNAANLNGLPPANMREPLYHAMYDEIMERREKRIAAYNHMTTVNTAVQQLKQLRIRASNLPFMSILDEDKLKGWIAELEVDYKSARRLYLLLRPKA